MMKALTHNIQQEREDQRDRSAQLFMWCIVVSMHQDDGIGASRLLRACNEMDAFEKKYQTAILYGSRKNATDAMRENLKGICDFEVRLPVDRAPRGRREEQLRMASNQGAEIAWLVMAATCHETFGYGKDRLARLKQNAMNNYKQYLEWAKEDEAWALDKLRRCVQDALKEDLKVTDTDDRKGMLSAPGRGPSIYETAAVYGDIQEGQSCADRGSARGVQRGEVRRNHDGRPETGQRHARLMTICPKECPDRHPGCHDYCERYAENKAAYQKMKQEYDGSVRNPYCRRWTHRAIVRSFKKKFR